MDYTASRDALFRPELSPTLFKPGLELTPTQLAVEACRLAYYKTETGAAELKRLADAWRDAGFAEVQPFHSGAFVDAQGFGAFRSVDGLAVIAFRGTEPDKLADLGTDANIVPIAAPGIPGNVHAGFFRAFDALRPQVDEWLHALGARVKTRVVCGHSLGAAMATIAAHVLRPDLLVTLGCPRTGDAQFVNALPCRFLRVVDCADLVPELPPALFGYTHPAPCLYIDRDGRQYDTPSADFIGDDQARGRIEYLKTFAWRHGTLALRDLADHAPSNYARAFF